ncbi:MAG TPA: diacylglycerol kinase [Usitatibacter sp.]|nr:diacylglycerol kinase [Usitatibacter sp.]
MRKKNRPFLERLGFAWSGIVAAWRAESSFRWQVAAAVAILAFAAIVRASASWWALFILLAVMVPAAELANTALERVIDRLHPEFHPDLEVAKDCAAAAVLVLSIGAVLVFLAFVVDRWLP